MRNTTRALAATLLLLLACALVPAQSDELVNVTCGARGQRPCVLLPYPDTGWLRGGLRVDGCDRGLKALPEICYWDTWLGEIPYPCFRCRSFTRELASDSMTGSFPVQALAEQHRLARDEPLNWFTRLGSHNAYNAYLNGYVINPNQLYSLTDQMNLGSRVLYLDTHEMFNGIKLSHQVGVPTDRHVVMAFREIREWIQDHPGEIVVLHFEDYWDSGDAGKHEFVQGLRNQLGTWLLRVNEKPAGRWPTTAEMLAKGRQVIANVGYDSRDGYFGDPPPYGSDIIFNSGLKDADGNKLYSGGNKARGFDCVDKYRNPGERFMTVWEESLRWGPFGSIYDGCGDTNLYDDSEPPGAICPGTDTCNKNPWHDPEAEPACANWANVRDLVACNVSTISLDQFGGSIWTGSPRAITVESPLAIFRDMIWSWEDEHFGWREDNKAAVLSTGNGRWRARSTGESHHYACGYLRQETGWHEGPMSDAIGPGTEWRVTTAAGTWAQGGKACMDEFGADGFLLSVPVNSLQNRQLLDAMASAGVDTVWLGYRDVDAASGSDHVAWQIDHGLGLATIDARPTPAFEGDFVTFDSRWTAGDIATCAAALGGESWLFGDGSPTAASGHTEVTPEIGARFSAWHSYADNGPYMVRHSLPVACGQDPHTRLQIVNNVAPRLRLGCDSWWSECSGRGGQDVRLYAGHPWTLQAAYLDAGWSDTHVANVDWGDGNQEAMSVTTEAVSEFDGVSGVIHAQHTFKSCETFAVSLEMVDDDGGRTSETIGVLVDEAPPEVTCPPTAVVEGTSTFGAPAALGNPKVVGGVCGLETTNDARDIYPYGDSIVHWTVRNQHESFNPETLEPVRHEASCTQTVKVVTRRCDFNRDGVVDMADYRELFVHPKERVYASAGDLDGDGHYNAQEWAVCFWRIRGRDAQLR